VTTSKRARQLERERLLRQAERRTNHARRQRRVALVSGLVVVIIVGGSLVGLLAYNSSSSNKSTVSASTTPTPTPTPSATPTVAGTKVCDYAADSATKTATSPGLPPDTKATGAHTLAITFKQGTYTGTVHVALSAKAPCTVNSFQFLASKKFFTNTICHRETASATLSVLQCGDPTGTGSGGPGYTIPDENLTGATYKAGTLAMANTGAAHTGGSQFFVVYKDSALPASYTPFGTVTTGLDVLAKIAAVGQNNANGTGDGAPKTPVTITAFTIT
jgi:peptidyl-prolyl cis-trans isomerase B (cyclophilin B)